MLMIQKQKYTRNKLDFIQPNRAWNFQIKNLTAVKLIGLILLSGFSMSSCRHARVTLDSPKPAECAQGFARKQACDIATAEMNARIEAKNGEVHTFEQVFYLHGLFPRKTVLDASGLCKNGVREIYQYATGKQGFLSEITIGIYVPRTTEVKCY